MKKFAIAYAAALLVMAALDALWLGVIAKPLYQQGIGHLMAEQPRIPVALLFYLLFPLGVLYFAVQPMAAIAPGWRQTLTGAALFGFFTYATYDLTNLATLKDWPVGLAALDVAWGVLISLASAAAARLALASVR